MVRNHIHDGGDVYRLLLYSDIRLLEIIGCSNTGIDTWRDSVSDYLIDRTEDRAANDNPVPRDFRS